MTSEHRTDALAALVAGGAVVVLSGAGLSTESGIPDYRGPSGASLRRHTPMTYQTFVTDARARRRYWARSHLGWQLLDRAEPNAGHLAVAALEDTGLVAGTITQNVDRLHQRAGSRRVIDLHGRLDRVVCLGCGALVDRTDVRARLAAANASWSATVTAVNPDGDVQVPDEQLDDFVPVDCQRCGGLLKPDVVYIGESVPAPRVAECYALLSDASLLLVLGTSLTVFSARRFVARATQDGIPVAVVNQGPTRADDLAVLKLEAPLGETLATVAESVVAVRR